MKLSQKEIAESFSNGKFEVAFPYLSENITWNVIGENIFNGKEKVVANCNQIANYFQTVNTTFKTNNVIEDNNLVVISGTAEFSRDNKRIAFVSACDVYEFNDDDELEKITSYCIPEKK